ncbi:MAG: universal stress protein [Chloroflexi bacterium]|nr:universal stress protein [Chloroflexota bacterium]
MQRFLVPLDGSHLAEQALPYAKEFVSKMAGTLYLVRVVTISRQLAAASMVGPGGMESMATVDVGAIDKAIELETQEARTYLSQQSERLQREGLRVEWEVRQGIPADEIREAVKAHNIDAVIITTHGRSGLGRVVFGSVSDRIIRDTHVPVIVIKPK